MKYSTDITQRYDEIAWEMRKFYEANKPLRWWQKRKPAAESCIADDLMLGLLGVITITQREIAVASWKQEYDCV